MEVEVLEKKLIVPMLGNKQSLPFCVDMYKRVGGGYLRLKKRANQHLVQNPVEYPGFLLIIIVVFPTVYDRSILWSGWRKEIEIWNSHMKA